MLTITTLHSLEDKVFVITDNYVMEGVIVSVRIVAAMDHLTVSYDVNLNGRVISNVFWRRVARTMERLKEQNDPEKLSKFYTEHTHPKKNRVALSVPFMRTVAANSLVNQNS